MGADASAARANEGPVRGGVPCRCGGGVGNRGRFAEGGVRNKTGD